ncbi:hypothetical protein BX285_6330 [Streptomyces sp. 1114.5]|uniref:hypothetical protein n=1 Tax=Streptomyces sp. 1114.5 TaxID=1938830 RepID=UPI000F130E12|nr:hypothetical protein [Streptomyces sp. 1114.5]RKT09252.1 hypothetical protein BX285_6330 [Streptomyces sp. 1114.5]
MRTRHCAVVGIVLAVLGVSACAADRKAGPEAAATSGPVAVPKNLREGLLTQERLPKGFRLTKVEADPTSTAASTTPVPIASLRCDELEVDSFMTRHAPPLENVAADLERTPTGGEGDGWFGRELLDRYAPGRAAEVMDAIRGAAKRCASFTTTLTDGTKIRETASVTPAGVPADDSLLIHFTSTFPGASKPFEKVTGFARQGDVILVVQHSSSHEPSTDTQEVLAAAVKSYRSAGG